MKRFLLLLVTLIVAAAAVAQVPSPALIVLNKGANELAIVDPVNLKVVGHVPTGEGPHEVAVSADGKTAYVGNYGTGPAPGSTLSVIDLASRKEVKRVNLGGLRRPHGIVENGGKIYFTCEGNKLIARYDPASGTLDWMMGTGQEVTHMLVMTADGKRIFTSNIGSGTVTELEQGPAGGWRATHITVGAGPEGIDMSPDGKEVWSAHSQDGGVSVINVESRKVTDTIPALTKHSNRIKFTPDGKRVLISDPQAGEVVIVDAATHKEIKRLQTGGQPLGIQMESLGNRAWVALAGDGAVAAIDLGKLEVTDKLPTGPAVDGMAWVK